MKRTKKNDINIVAGLPPVAKKGQLVTMDFEMFNQTDGKLHRPNGSFALISTKLQGDPTVYQLYDQKDLRKLVSVVKAGTWTFHNALYDLRQFRRYATVQPRYIVDTMLIEQAMNGGLYQNFGLADLTRRYLGKVMEKETRDHFSEGRELTPEMLRYAAIDVINTEEIALLQLEKYENDPGFKAYKYADEPMIFPILDMQGFRVDVAGWETMVKEFERMGRAIEEEIDLNVYSSAKVKDRLRKRYRINVDSTKNEILVSLLDDAKGEARAFIEKIIEARMYRKAASTYGMKWIEQHVEEDGKVYSDYKITGADTTGRMSSAGPNMQNIPSRKLPVYRERFLASPGHLMEVWDVSQQEPSITAYHSQDKKLLEALRAGISTHLAVAREIYDNPNLSKSSHKDEYNHGKQINLGLTYGLTEHGLSRRTGLTLEEAGVMIRKYFMKFSGVHSYIQMQRRNAFRDGYVTTALGRRSYMNPYDRKWENNAINSPIQGGAADFTKIWARKTWEGMRSAKLPQTTNGFIHDEITRDTPREIVRQAEPIIQQAFVETGEFLYKNIPFAVEYEYGTTWAAKSIEAERISLDDLEGDE